jgi:O-antigen ligase
MPASPATLLHGPADLLFLLLAVSVVVWFLASADRVKTAATVFVVALPLVDLPGTRLGGSRAATLLAVAVVVLLLALVAEGELRRLFTPRCFRAWLPLGLLLLWAGLTGLAWTGSSWDAWGRFARPAATSLLVLLAARRGVVARAMARAFVATMAVVSAVAVVEFFWGRFIWSIGRTRQSDYEYFIRVGSGLVRAPGTFEDPNNMGLFAGLAFLIVVLALLERVPGLRRLGLVGLAVLLLAGLAASLTRSAALGTAVALAVLWPRRRRLSARSRLLLAAVACAMLAVLLVRSGGAGSEGLASVKHRLLYWKAALQLARENPLAGIGLGNFSARFTASHAALPLKIGGLPSHRPHSALLQMAVETGGVGLALFLAFLAPPFLALLRRGDVTARAGAALATATFVHAALHNVLLQDLFWLVAGVTLAIAIEAPAGGGEREVDGLNGP